MQKISSVNNAITENVSFAMGMSTQVLRRDEGEQGGTKKRTAQAEKTKKGR